MSCPASIRVSQPSDSPSRRILLPLVRLRMILSCSIRASEWPRRPKRLANESVIDSNTRQSPSDAKDSRIPNVKRTQVRQELPQIVERRRHVRLSDWCRFGDVAQGSLDRC